MDRNNNTEGSLGEYMRSAAWDWFCGTKPVLRKIYPVEVNRGVVPRPRAFHDSRETKRVTTGYAEPRHEDTKVTGNNTACPMTVVGLSCKLTTASLDDSF